MSTTEVIYHPYDGDKRTGRCRRPRAVDKEPCGLPEINRVHKLSPDVGRNQAEDRRRLGEREDD